MFFYYSKRYIMEIDALILFLLQTVCITSTGLRIRDILIETICTPVEMEAEPHLVKENDRLTQPALPLSYEEHISNALFPLFKKNTIPH